MCWWSCAASQRSSKPCPECRSAKSVVSVATSGSHRKIYYCELGLLKDRKHRTGQFQRVLVQSAPQQPYEVLRPCLGGLSSSSRLHSHLIRDWGEHAVYGGLSPTDGAKSRRVPGQGLFSSGSSDTNPVWLPHLGLAPRMPANQR